MKIKKLIVRNIGPLEDVEIAFDKPLILFYGEVRQGKSSLINSIRWCFGGSFPSDIIRHGQDEALVRLEFDGGSVSREWYRSKKDGTTKAREIEFNKDGATLSKPVTQIEKLLNPFLLNQNHLVDMGEADRRAYFTTMFATDTKEMDIVLSGLEKEASELRAQVRTFPFIDLTPVPDSDTAAIRAELEAVKSAHAAEVKLRGESINAAQKQYQSALQEVTEKNARIRTNNAEIAGIVAESLMRGKRIEALKVELAREEERLKPIDQAIASKKRIEELPNPPAPDISAMLPVLNTGDLDQRLAQSIANDAMRGVLEQNKDRQKQKEGLKAKADQVEQRQRELKRQKIAKLKEVTDASGIVGLEFDEFGNFTYEDTQAGMLSTSQLMRLSSALSDLYPEGFGLDMIDRAESLGRSIFELVKRAQDEDKTILASVVGEAPATIPDHVGVFVVDKGRVKQVNKSQGDLI